MPRKEQRTTWSLFVVHGVMHYESISQWQIEKQYYHTDTLRYLHKNVQQKQPVQWNFEL